MLTNDLALSFGVLDAAQSAKKAFFRIDADKIEIPAFESGFNEVALVLAHQSMIDEHAMELPRDRLGEKCRNDRGIDAARECEENLSVADLLAHLFYEACLKVF